MIPFSGAVDDKDHSHNDHDPAKRLDALDHGVHRDLADDGEKKGECRHKKESQKRVCAEDHGNEQKGNK